MNRFGVFYNKREDKIYLGEFLKEELFHILLSSDDYLWTSSLLLDMKEFEFVGPL
jgi:hypothetical protein